VITEGISNKQLQLVQRGDAVSRDSSRYSASPGEAVDNLKTPDEKSILGSVDLADKVDISRNQVEAKQEGETELEKAQEAAKVRAESVVDTMIQDLNDKFDRSSLRLRFGTDEESGLEYYQLYDRNNGDVIKQYPPEEMLDMMAQLKDLTGVIFNENV